MARRRKLPGQPRPVDLACPDADDHAATTTSREGVSKAVDGLAVSITDLARVEADGSAFDEQVRRAMEDLERRRADRELRDTLARADFQGPIWTLFATDLVLYGHAVVTAWLVSGEMFHQCRVKGCYSGPPPSPGEWTRDDREGLADETVVLALKSFRERGLIGGAWIFDGGASLKTYFVGACVYAFPNVFRAWRTERDHWTGQQRVGLTHDEACMPQPDDPAVLAVRQIQIGEGLSDIPDQRTKKALCFQALGHTYEEIAELLGMPTAGAVAQLFVRHRKRIDDRNGGQGRDD